MDYEKAVVAPDGEPEGENLISLNVAEHVVKLILGGSLPGEVPGTRDPDAAIDGVLLALALIMEQAPEAATPRALRQQSEAFGKHLLYHAKIARAAFERDGIHPIAHIDKAFGPSTPASATVN